MRGPDKSSAQHHDTATFEGFFAVKEDRSSQQTCHFEAWGGLARKVTRRTGDCCPLGAVLTPRRALSACVACGPQSNPTTCVLSLSPLVRRGNRGREGK